ncbi:hypothetical protein JYT87_01645, partial [Nitrospira defluvii]|nr:hypothetical protein [Nitrospira defluvii]
KSGDFLLFSIDPQRERIPDDDTLQGIPIPKGNYHYTHTNIILLSDTRRLLSGEFDLLWGGLYDGRKTSLNLSLTAAPDEGIKLGAGIEMDWLRLPQGNFTGQILNGEIDWSLSNTVLVQGLVQWDKEEQFIAGNFRFSWEYEKDSYFYLIVNPSRQDNDDLLLILAKITWLWEPL